MVRDWLREREYAITLLASYLRQAALLVLSKIAKGFVVLCSYGHPVIFPTMASVNIHLRIFPTLALVDIV